jgi:hypothetical protein
MLAVRLQLSELEEHLLFRRDAQLAVDVFVGLDGASGGACDADGELAALQAQIAALTLTVQAYEGRQAAAEVSAADTEQQRASAASAELAAALAAQEAWDADVLRARDAQLARAIAACGEDEWERVGDRIESPLDLSARPSLPATAAASGGGPPASAAAAAAAAAAAPVGARGGGARPAARGGGGAGGGARDARARPRPSRQAPPRAGAPPPTAPSASSALPSARWCVRSCPERSRRRRRPRAAAATTSALAACGSLWAASCRQAGWGRSPGWDGCVQPQLMQPGPGSCLAKRAPAFDTSYCLATRALCGGRAHRTHSPSLPPPPPPPPGRRAQARRFPLCCPQPGCREELSHGDVQRLLRGSPKLVQVRAQRSRARRPEGRLDREARAPGVSTRGDWRRAQRVFAPDAAAGT